MKTYCVFASLCLALSLSAQTAAPPDAPALQQQRDTKAQKRGVTSFWPAVSTAGSTEPLTPGQKFLLFGYNTVNPFPIGAAAFTAGISQALNSNEGYGQGAEGYGKRFGAAYADKASTQFFGTFLFPVLLRQDPRYFRKETGTARSRIQYAVSRVFVTRTDSGHNAPNVSFLLASASSAALSNTYYPPGNRSAGDAAVRLGIDFATQVGFDLAKEFWPDLKHRFSKKK